MFICDHLRITIPRLSDHPTKAVAQPLQTTLASVTSQLNLKECKARQPLGSLQMVTKYINPASKVFNFHCTLPAVCQHYCVCWNIKISAHKRAFFWRYILSFLVFFQYLLNSEMWLLQLNRQLYCGAIIIFYWQFISWNGTGCFLRMC